MWIHWRVDQYFFTDNTDDAKKKTAIFLSAFWGYTKRLITKGFMLTSCCSRLRIWVGCFICFKFTRVFFHLMFLMCVLVQLSRVQMKDEMVLSCLKLKENSFKPLKQSMFTFTTKTF